MPVPRPREVFDFEDDALKHFVDREDALAVARELVMDTPFGDEAPLLVFYGIGGMGKSTLLRKIRHDICQECRPDYREAHVPHSFVDFAHPRANVHDTENFIHYIKRELEYYQGFRFPRFELVLAGLRVTQRIAPADRPGELPILLDVLGNLPAVGDFIAAVRRAKDLDCFRHRAYHRFNIPTDWSEWKHPYQAVERLAPALADDINDMLQNGGRRPALLFDSLDWLDLRNERDGLVQAVTDLCQGLPAVPIIVGTRAQDEDNVGRFPCFADGRKTQCFCIDVIPPDDNGRYRRDYLTSREVCQDSHDAIIGVTGGHALWMGVAADIALRIQEDEGRALTAQDLHDAAEDREKLFARLAEALDEKTDHRHLLRHACVCRWFDRKLLSAVIGGEVTYEAFKTLTRLSMVRVARTDDQGRSTAWALHPTVRDIAIAWLADEGALAELGKRGAAYCEEQEGAPWDGEGVYFLMLTAPNKGLSQARRLFDQRVNFAWDRELGVRVVEAVEHGWRAHHLRVVPEPGQPWELHAFKADLEMMGGNSQAALSWNKSGLVAAQREADLNGQGRMWNNIGITYQAQGAYEDALQSYRRSLLIFRRIGHDQGQAGILSNMGIVHEAQGRHEDALDAYEKAFKLAKKSADKHLAATLLTNIAIVNEETGRYGYALRLYRGSLKLKRQLGDRLGASSTLANMAGLLGRCGHHEKALRLLQKDLKTCRQHGDRHSEATTLGNMAAVRNLMGDRRGAHKLFRDALQIFHELNDCHGEGKTLLNIGITAANEGDLGTARRSATEALKLLESIGVPEADGARQLLAALAHADDETQL